MVKCSAPLCSNSSYRKAPDITLHRFPKDEDLRKAWVVNMKRKNWQPTSCSVLCSKHFKAHLLDQSGFRTKLAPSAIPTIFYSFLHEDTNDTFSCDISIVKTETLEDPGSSIDGDKQKDPLETGCVSPSGLSDIGSDDLEGEDNPLVTQLKQQLLQMKKQLRQKDQQLNEKDILLKHKDKQLKKMYEELKDRETQIKKMRKK